MKLTKNPFALSDTITTDDGVIIGVIYYNNQPIDDAERKAPEVFREWWESVQFTAGSNHIASMQEWEE